jgi:hypothetical protein
MKNQKPDFWSPGKHRVFPEKPKNPIVPASPATVLQTEASDGRELPQSIQHHQRPFRNIIEVPNSVALAAPPLEVSGSCQMGQTANKSGVLLLQATIWCSAFGCVVRQSVN